MENNENNNELQFEEDYAEIFNSVNSEENTTNEEVAVDTIIVEKNVTEEQNTVPEVVKPVVENKTVEVPVEDTKSKPLTEEGLEKFYAEREKKREEEVLANKKLEEEKEIENKRKIEEEKETIFKDFQFDNSKVLTEKENKQLSDFSQEFPEIMDVVQFEMKKIRAEYDEKIKFLEKNTKKDLTNSTFGMYDKFSKEILPQVAPLRQQLEEQNKERFLNQVEQKHPGFREESFQNEFNNWINNQDSDYQNLMVQMLQSGNVDKVSTVFGYFKRDAGITQKVKEEDNRKSAEEENKHKVMSRKEALIGVNSKSSSSVSSSQSSNNNYDDDDYESAWNSVKV